MFTKNDLMMIFSESDFLRELEEELDNWVQDNLSGKNWYWFEGFTVDNVELDGCGIRDIISFEESADSEDAVTVTGLLAIDLPVNCFRYYDHDNFLVGTKFLKGQIRFSVRIFDREEPEEIEFSDLEVKIE